MNSFSLIVSFYTCSDIQIHSFLNISHKNMTFPTLSYYLHVLLLLQHLREVCIFLFCCSLLQKKKIFLLSHLCSVIFLPFIYLFSNGPLSSWIPISLRSSLWHILQYFGGLPCLSLLSNAVLSLFIRYRICP